MSAFNNQEDSTRDLVAEVRYPLCTKFGLRINPGQTAEHTPGIPHEALKKRLQETGHWDRWLAWGGHGITVGAAGVYAWDVEDFLAGVPNTD